ncbi:DNA gyrase inhibitor YacG [Roseobacter weihaiensis]|uniref:DNA gyrase inhibitor YacG n=1 Tax=Roseobacter weihaiensis TaxID=2763262 RepID=UPI001D09EB9C|nr:DNA gyrase inhibitor YacG [Roseobacter sp. H9]
MTCPMCGKPTSKAARPFCSKRCADLDLARWLNGSYAVPSDEPDDLADLDEALDTARRAARKEKPH